MISIKRPSNVYILENLVNGKLYVGKANDLKDRMRRHIDCVEVHSSYPLYRAMKKYGIENFQIHLAEEYSSEQEAFQGERDWISYLLSFGKRLYNQTTGGEGIPGHTHSEITKSKIGIGNKGKLISEECKAKISKTLTGRKMTADACKKVSAALKGKKKPTRSQEHCKKISLAKTGLSLSENHKSKISVSMKLSPRVGHLHTEETKQLYSLQRKGKKMKDDTKSNISASLKGKPWSEARRLAYELSKLEDAAE